MDPPPKRKGHPEKCHENGYVEFFPLDQLMEVVRMSILYDQGE